MMKNVIYLIVFSVFVISCKERGDTLAHSGFISSFGDQPSVTTGPNNEIGIVFGSGDSIFFSVSTDKGASFSEPALVDRLKGLMLGYSSGPGIVMTSDHTIITAPDRDGNLHSWTRSTNDESWSGPFRINDVDKSAGECLSAITSTPDGRLFCTWIDTRFLEMSGHKMENSMKDKKSEPKSAEQKDDEDLNKMTPIGITRKELYEKIGSIPENAQLAFHDDNEGNLLWVFLDEEGEALKAENYEAYKQFRRRNGNRVRPKGRIYISSSTDGGISWSKSKMVYQSPDGSVCECCKPSIKGDTEGNVIVMFRNNLDESRDLHFTKSVDGGATFSQPEKLGTGTWKIDGCPMDGGGLIVSDTSGLNTVWQRNGEIFLANSSLDEQMIGYGRSPSISNNDQKTYIVFSAGADITAVDPETELQDIIGIGTFPKVIALENGALYFWVSENGIQYKRI